MSRTRGVRRGAGRALLAAALVLAPALLLATPGTVEKIEIQGLRRMTRVAFLHALDIEEGDLYERQKLSRRFKALWKLGLFEDITFETEVGAEGGTVLVIKIKERPVLTSVTYEENKVVSRTAIEDRLKERERELKLGKPIDMGAVFFAESAIRDLLSEQGFLNATVEARVRPVTETSRAVHIEINPGGKTRIRKIEFIGNERFSDRRLRSILELTRQRRWYWPWSSKNLYHQVKWDQDIGGVRDLYQNLGHLDVEIRPPVVEVIESGHKGARPRDAGETGDDDGPKDLEPAVAQQLEPFIPEPPPDDLSPKQLRRWEDQQQKKQEKLEKKARKLERKEKAAKEKRWVHLTVPIKEGPQYTLGEVTIEGNEVFTERQLRPMIPLRTGNILNNGIIEFGVDRIGRLYANKGHLYANAVRRINRREGETVADVEVIIDEDRPYTISRIDFVGNSNTHDAVLRREMLLDEGDLFRRDDLDISKIKVNQLGYWLPDEPIVEPVTDVDQVRIVIPGVENSRNEIQVGGGFSEFDGAFFSGVYSTRNFLGRGQILAASITVGGRSNRYQISFTEPYFLNRPYTLGFSLFRRDTDFGSSLKNTSNGFGVVLGKRLGRFTRMNIGYNFESVNSETVLVTTDTPTIVEQTFKISSIVPVLTYSTINNPYRPTAGRAFTFSVQIAGGPLGGDTALLKPVARFTAYKRLNRRLNTAFHLQLGWVGDWAGGSDAQSSLIGGVPRFQRYWLGGDTQGPRVFETRSITPLRYVVLGDDNNIAQVLGDPRLIPVEDLLTGGGQPVTVEAGGNRFWLSQNELIVPINEQAEIAFFLDAGDSLFETQSIGLDTIRASAGIELRFHLPIFPVPLRLIYGVPLRELEGDRSSNFTFSIGRSF